MRCECQAATYAAWPSLWPPLPLRPSLGLGLSSSSSSSASAGAGAGAGAGSGSGSGAASAFYASLFNNTWVPPPEAHASLAAFLNWSPVFPTPAVCLFRHCTNAGCFFFFCWSTRYHSGRRRYLHQEFALLSIVIVDVRLSFYAGAQAWMHIEAKRVASDVLPFCWEFEQVRPFPRASQARASLMPSSPPECL